jgi:hypothetical protein
MKFAGRFLFIFVMLSSISMSQNSNNVLIQSGPKMNTNRMGHYSMALPNGNVVLIGGHGTGFVSLNTAEIYDTTSKTFTEDSMQYIHDFGAVSDLSDGTWLIAGGSDNLGIAPGTNSAEIYNPGSGSFTACSSMVYSRCVTTAVRLANNNVLVVGGWYDQPSATYGEVFNFSTKSFTATQALVTPRSNAVAIATADSGAVIFGGYYYYGGTWYENVEYYNSKTNSFTQLQNHLFPGDSGWCITSDMFFRPMPSQRMKSGQYLISAWKQSPQQYMLGTFDPATKSFAELELSTPLPSGDSIQFSRAPVLDTSKNVAYWFGIKANSDPWVIQVFTIDLATKTWQASQAYTTDYYWTSAGMTLMHNGNILITGGTTSNDENTNFTPVDSTLIVSVSSIATGVKNNSAERNLPVNYLLYQNFPNPFNPATTISYALPRQSKVRLSIFNLLGQEVLTLVDRSEDAGYKSVSFDASALPSGVYFYRLEASSFLQTKRLVLVK